MSSADRRAVDEQARVRFEADRRTLENFAKSDRKRGIPHSQALKTGRRIARYAAATADRLAAVETENQRLRDALDKAQQALTLIRGGMESARGIALLGLEESNAALRSPAEDPE